MRKYIVKAAKLVGAGLLEFAEPEFAEVVSGRKIFKTDAKNVGRQTLRKQGNRWVVVAGKALQAASFQQNLQNKPVGREETFSPTFLINHVE